MKPLLIALIILISISIATQAKADEKPLTGQAKIDSLLKELPKAKGDTNEVNLLTNLSFKYFTINPDKGIEYGKRAIKIANKLNFQEGLARAYNNIGVNYAGGKSDYNLALLMYNKALKIYENMDYKYGIGTTINNIALIHQFDGNLDKAIEYFRKSADLAKESDNTKGYAGALNNIGNVYNDWGEYSKALEYFQRSMKVYSEINNKPGISFCFTNIGLIYSRLSDYKNALEYYKKAIEVQVGIGDERGVANSKSNIGIMLVDLERYSESKIFLQEALEYFYQIDNKESISNVYTNLGILEKQQSNYKKALEYFKKSYDLRIKKPNKIRIAKAIANIGSCYYSMALDSTGEILELKDYNKSIYLNKAIKYFEEAILIFKNEGEIYERANFCKELSEAYELIGERIKAFKYFKEFHFLKDSIFNIEKTQKIAALTSEINIVEKDKEIEKHKLIISEQEKRENLILYFSSFSLFALSIVIFIIYRQRKKADNLLLNILPAEIAKRLKQRNGDIADDIENASTVFIDLVGFTAYSKDKKASDVLKMLNQIFSRIDKLVLKHGLEKIKTIGDGYMAAAGVPEYQQDHAKRAAEFALDVQKELKKFNAENGTDISARIGIESGVMVAGVIGDMKFIYDLWGDSVNTASRMESTGTPKKVHITENFKLELEKHQNGFLFSEPIEMEIKGKGKMKTYFIEEK